MKKRFLAAAIILCNLFLIPTLSYGLEPRNLDLSKQELMQYQSSGAYSKDQKAVIDEAKAYLKSRLSTLSTKPLAIVLDIDETALSNYRDMVALSFGGSPADVMREEAKGTNPAIESTLALYRYAKANKIAIFFITSRTENYRSITEKNLKNAGFADWDDLILKPESFHDKLNGVYKTAARKMITNKGYDIALNMGDQESDLVGGYADRTFKLPNPYYFTP